jgi:hypothetical protein
LCANPAAAAERGERAAQRRKTWTDRQVPLHDSGDEPVPERSTTFPEVWKGALTVRIDGQRMNVIGLKELRANKRGHRTGRRSSVSVPYWP